MKNLYSSEKFISVKEDCYFIILPLFSFTEDFNISLLEFLALRPLLHFYLFLALRARLLNKNEGG